MLTLPVRPLTASRLWRPHLGEQRPGEPAPLKSFLSSGRWNPTGRSGDLAKLSRIFESQDVTGFSCRRHECSDGCFLGWEGWEVWNCRTGCPWEMANGS